MWADWGPAVSSCLANRQAFPTRAALQQEKPLATIFCSSWGSTSRIRTIRVRYAHQLNLDDIVVRK